MSTCSAPPPAPPRPSSRGARQSPDYSFPSHPTQYAFLHLVLLFSHPSLLPSPLLSLPLISFLGCLHSLNLPSLLSSFPLILPSPSSFLTSYDLSFLSFPTFILPPFTSLVSCFFNTSFTSSSVPPPTPPSVDVKLSSLLPAHRLCPAPAASRRRPNYSLHPRRAATTTTRQTGDSAMGIMGEKIMKEKTRWWRCQVVKEVSSQSVRGSPESGAGDWLKVEWSV